MAMRAVLQNHRQLGGLLALAALVACGSDADADRKTTTCAADGEERGCYSGAPMTVGIGICRAGAERCSGGVWSACEGEELPTTEVCDGLDNDCNGMADEGCPCDAGATRSCYSAAPPTSGVGVCQQGVQTCVDAIWGLCVGEVVPSGEACDGLDNDCTGILDEGCACIDEETQHCYTGATGTEGQGPCHGATQVCVDGQWPLTCAGEVVPQAETCNGTDEDCDGVADEGCACINGQTEPCYTGAPGTKDKGICHGGTHVCTNGQWPPTCNGQVLPQTETCNGVDDDCDGTVDDGGVCCVPSCAPHDACGSDGCSGSCGSTCSNDPYPRVCRSGRCAWDAINTGAVTCNTFCFWGNAVCIGTSTGVPCSAYAATTCYCW